MHEKSINSEIGKSSRRNLITKQWNKKETNEQKNVCLMLCREWQFSILRRCGDMPDNSEWEEPKINVEGRNERANRKIELAKARWIYCEFYVHRASPSFFPLSHSHVFVAIVVSMLNKSVVSEILKKWVRVCARFVGLISKKRGKHIKEIDSKFGIIIKTQQLVDDIIS